MYRSNYTTAILCWVLVVDCINKIINKKLKRCYFGLPYSRNTIKYEKKNTQNIINYNDNTKWGRPAMGEKIIININIVFKYNCVNHNNSILYVMYIYKDYKNHALVG